jgi:uncharacterized membrane protein YbhN (UPF0104 family)
MKKKLIERLFPLLTLGILILSLWVLSQELRHYQIREVLHSLTTIPINVLCLAIIGTVASYLMITGYDFIAFCYLKYSLPPGAIVFTALVSYIISNNIGFATLSGGAIRYRLYSHWGVPARIVAIVTAFSNLSFWLGLCAVGGVVFLVEPLTIPKLLNIPFASAHPLGIIFLLLVIAYLTATIFYRRSVSIGKQIFVLPSFGLSLAQILISLLDWALAAGVLYILLPIHDLLSYPGFFGIYLLAMAAGIVSHVPGGLGVFETIVVLLLPGKVNSAQALGSLLIYRGIYYLLPLLVAVGLLAGYEIFQKVKNNPNSK